MATGLAGRLHALSGELGAVVDRLEVAALTVTSMVRGGVKLEAEHQRLVDTTKWSPRTASDWAMLAQSLDRPR